MESEVAGCRTVEIGLIQRSDSIALHFSFHMMKLQILREVLLHSFLVLLVIGSAVSVFVGAFLLLSPDRARRLNQAMSRWVDTHRFGDALDKPRRVEKFIYRHHRVVGALITVGALYVLNFFLLTPNARNIAAMLNVNRLGLMDSLVSMFVIGSVLATAIGLMMMLKPSILRELEQMANRWISTDIVTRFFNAKHQGADGFILRYGKFFAPLFIVGGGYTFVRIGTLLLNGTWRSIL